MFSFETIHRFLKRYPARSYLIAYSGGLDSHALLHACARLQHQQADFSFRAIHIDHGLQKESTAWVKHCLHTCAELSISLHVDSLNLVIPNGASLESVARDARLSAFADHLLADEILLTAHHQDDQAETLLLNLLRGAGVNGLAAMPESRVFSETLLCRPLLNISRQQLETYADQHKLDWIEDPSNQSGEFDRNYLRHEIMPRLQQRWPASNAILARAAQWQSERAEVQAFFLEKERVRIAGAQQDTLAIDKLLRHSVSMQKALLRHWLKRRQFMMPSAKKLTHVLNDVLLSKPDAKPCVSWQGCEIRRYRGDLYAITPDPEHDPQQILVWQDLNQPLSISSLRISLCNDSFMSLCPLLMEFKKGVTVRFRQGGEKLVTRQGHRISLKQWLQDQGIPPWRRSRIPLVYAGNQIIAIPGLYSLDVDKLIVD